MNRMGILGAAVGAVLLLGGSAMAQVGANQPIRQSVKGSALSTRSPGSLTSQARQAYEVRTNALFAGIEIVDEESLSLGQELLIESLQIVFEQLNLAINALHNAILARGGRSFVLPTPVFPESGSSTTTPTLPGLGGLDLGTIGGLLDQFGPLLPTTGNR